jgi:hypothetical protein
MEYVSRVLLEIDGKELTDFDEVTENEEELYKAVELMNKTGFAEKLPRYGCKVKYVIPKDDPEFDFRSVKNGRLTIDRQNGTRITFSGVYPLKIGEATYSKDEVSRGIDFGAEDRIEE